MPYPVALPPTLDQPPPCRLQQHLLAPDLGAVGAIGGRRLGLLAHQLALPSRDWPRLSRFVERGGKLIVEGATGYFDEHQVCVMQTGFPLDAGAAP